MKSQTLELACQLLERPSVTPNDEGCQQIIAQYLQKLGFTIHHFPFNQVSNLFAVKGTGEPSFCFAGHTDVVPTGEQSAWRSPPFTPTIEGNTLTARGAADMKSSIAAMITACERFIKNHPNHPGSLSFLITSDEEGPAIDGTQAVLKALQQQNLIPKWCLVGEASSTEKLADTIKVGRRGSMTGYLTIMGKQGHVAYPQLAHNPIHHAMAALDEIVSHVWDQGSAPFPATSLQFANIHAGTGATNVIPGTLEANFNLRYSPLTTPDRIQQTVENILTKHGCQFELRWVIGGKPFYTPDTSQFIQKVSHTIEKTLGYAPIHSTSGGTSDGRFFAEYGTEVVEVGPLNASIHQINEHICVDELEKLSELYEEILISSLT
ncbi:MAG: succinyl-diaminopimelate desuccinylase [Candidatus Berkiella sp.]